MTNQIEFVRPTRHNVSIGDFLLGVDHHRRMPILAPITEINVEENRLFVSYGYPGNSGSYSSTFEDAIILTRNNPQYLIGEKAIMLNAYNPSQ